MSDLTTMRLCLCGCGQSTRVVNGVPNKYVHGHNTATESRPIEERLARLVQWKGPDQCWEFAGSKDESGYGMIIAYEGKGNAWTERAHRVAWRIAKGEIPSGLLVCHRCDNPPCCNPEHLFLGTIADNNHDKERKGRAVHVFGELVPSAKLTAEQVTELRARRAAGESSKSLSRRFGIAVNTVAQITRRDTWKHVA